MRVCAQTDTRIVRNIRADSRGPNCVTTVDPPASSALDHGVLNCIQGKRLVDALAYPRRGAHDLPTRNGTIMTMPFQSPTLSSAPIAATQTGSP